MLIWSVQSASRLSYLQRYFLLCKSMINVTFSVDLSALERSVAKGACCGESQAASHIVLLLLWLFKAIESALWPSSAFNEGFLRPAHHQPRGRRGSRGAIALQILAGIEAKPSPFKSTHPDFQTFLRLEPRTQCY